MTSPTQTLVRFAEQVLQNKSLTPAVKQERYRLLMQLAKEANSRHEKRGSDESPDASNQ